VEETYEAVVLDGQRYLCSIPVVEPLEQNTTATPEQARDEEEKELMRATDRGWELLEGMLGNCIYFHGGWWSYSFCYQDGVKQFHAKPPSRSVPIYPPVEDPDVHSFVLGRFPGAKSQGRGGKKGVDEKSGESGSSRKTLDAEPDDGKISTEVARLETKGSTRYMVQRLSGGTECDLTGKERKIEVQVSTSMLFMI
jgi:protein OS-9